MTTIASVAVQSIAAEPVKHAASAAVGIVGVSAGPDFLTIAIGVSAIAASVTICLKTYKEIRLLNIKLAKEDRRSKP